jgi:ion channel
VPVQFDEREEETEPSQIGLRRPGENLTHRHREANVTAPLLDSTQQRGKKGLAASPPHWRIWQLTGPSSTSRISSGDRTTQGILTPLLFTGLTVTFLKQFCIGLWLTLPLLLSLALAVTLLGLAVGRQEGWSRFDSFYWSFITATTVGYGDVRPVKRRSKVVAIIIAFLGLTLSGIVIAVAVEAATLALSTAHR